ncbi:hypothetical protein WDW89_15145 [Deltaproteobacteria bacterium TL4]
MTDEELKELIASLAISQKETDRQLNEKFAKTDMELKETSRIIKELSKNMFFLTMTT